MLNGSGRDTPLLTTQDRPCVMVNAYTYTYNDTHEAGAQWWANLLSMQVSSGSGPAGECEANAYRDDALHTLSQSLWARILTHELGSHKLPGPDQSMV